MSFSSPSGCCSMCPGSTCHTMEFVSASAMGGNSEKSETFEVYSIYKRRGNTAGLTSQSAGHSLQFTTVKKQYHKSVRSEDKSQVQEEKTQRALHEIMMWREKELSFNLTTNYNRGLWSTTLHTLLHLTKWTITTRALSMNSLQSSICVCDNQ